MALSKTISTVSLNIIFFGSLVIFMIIKISICVKNNKDHLSCNVKEKFRFNKLADKGKKFLSKYKNSDNLFSLGLKLIIAICIIFLCANFIEYASKTYAYGFSDLSRHEITINKISDIKILSDILNF